MIIQVHRYTICPRSAPRHPYESRRGDLDSSQLSVRIDDEADEQVAQVKWAPSPAPIGVGKDSVLASISDRYAAIQLLHNRVTDSAISKRIRTVPEDMVQCRVCKRCQMAVCRLPGAPGKQCHRSTVRKMTSNAKCSSAFGIGLRCGSTKRASRPVFPFVHSIFKAAEIAVVFLPRRPAFAVPLSTLLDFPQIRNHWSSSSQSTLSQRRRKERWNHQGHTTTSESYQSLTNSLSGSHWLHQNGSSST